MIGFFENKKSPNYSSRHDTIIDTIIVHHTADDLQPSLNWLCNPRAKASAHIVVDRNGDIYSLVDLKHKAWHAGQSEWDYDGDGKIVTDEYGINARSLGIELVSFGDTYTTKQMTALVYLCMQWIHLYSIQIKNILGHKEIAPGRKIDPGNFNMDLFRNAMQALYNVRTKVIIE